MRAAPLVLVLVLTGCGVPQDAAPRALDPAEAPFSTTSPEPVAEPVGPGRVALYFVRDDRLVLTTRAVRRAAAAPALLDLLLAGPTPEEIAAGTSSRIPASLTVEQVEVDGDIALVTLGGPADQVISAQALAFAQIVSTLTAPGRFAGVRFRLDGEDLQVPRGDGLLTFDPLDRGDYAELGVPASPGPAPPPA